MRIEGRTVVITGATSGIGLALAAGLWRAGNKVIVVGRDGDKVRSVEDEYPGIYGYVCDVTLKPDVRAMRDKILEEHPETDVLINNAGVMRKIDLKDTRDGNLDYEIAVNLGAPIDLIDAFIPHLVTRKSAAVINVTSGLAYVPFSLAPVYSASKAGLRAYTRCLRAQLRNTSVSVIEIAPPPTDTKLFHGDFSSEDVGNLKPMSASKLVERVLSGIAAGKEEIAPGLASVLRLLGRVMPERVLRIVIASGSKP